MIFFDIAAFHFIPFGMCRHFFTLYAEKVVALNIFKMEV